MSAVFKVFLFICLLSVVLALPTTKFNVHQEPNGSELSRIPRSLANNDNILERLLDNNDHLINEVDLQSVDEEVHILNRGRYPCPTISVRTRSGRILNVYKC